MATRKKIDVAQLIDKMKLEVIDTASLTPYARNPRINEEAVDAVANSIQRFGFRVPIVVHGENNEIVNGHTRYKAAKQLGLKRVPCLRADELNANEIKALRLVDNKVGEIAKWDDVLLDLEIDSLANVGDISLGDFGFDVSLEEQPAEAEKNDDEEENSSPTEYGIVYEISFENEEQQARWFKFIKLLKSLGAGDTIAEKLLNVAEQWMTDNGGNA